MKQFTKQTLWMSSAIAIALTGCQSAPTKVAEEPKVYSADEDVRFEQEVLETFSRKEDVSDWMDFYEDRIKSGQFKLSAEHKAYRGIAFVALPLAMDIVRASKSNADLIAKPLLQLAEQMERTLAKNENRVAREFKTVEELGNYVDTAAGRKFHANLTEEFAKQMRANPTKYSVILRDYSVLAKEKELAKQLSEYRAKLDGANSPKGKPEGRVADALIETDYKKVVNEQKTNLTDVAANYITKTEAAFLDDAAAQLKAGKITEAEYTEIVENVKGITTADRRYVTAVGGVPPTSIGCKLATGSAADSKNLRNLAEFRANYVEARVKAKLGNCPASQLGAMTQFQRLILKRTQMDTALYAAMTLCECGTCRKSTVGAEANRELAKTKITFDDTKVKCAK